MRCGRAGAGCWWCSVSPGWASPRYWTTWPGTRQGAGCCGRRGWSRRWSWRSPGCISCWRRSWTGSTSCRGRSGRRCRPRSASARARCRAASWWGWPCWGWCRRWRPSGRWCAWSMTSSGWTAPRCRRWGLWRGGWRPGRAASCLGAGGGGGLGAEPVGLVFAARVAGAELAGLPELAVEGLGAADARTLLNAALTGPVDERVRDLIVAETRGNPLALLELPRGLAPAELAGGFGLPGAVSLPGRIEDSFRRQLEGLPAETRWLLALAAADPSGDPLLVWRAAARLGIATGAGTPAVSAGLLVEFGARVQFRHPLVRSAAYRSAPVQQRREIHRALAEAPHPPPA